MRTSKRLRTLAVASAAAMTLGLAACENGDAVDDGVDDGVDAPVEDDGGELDDGDDMEDDGGDTDG